MKDLFANKKSMYDSVGRSNFVSCTAYIPTLFFSFSFRKYHL